MFNIGDHVKITDMKAYPYLTTNMGIISTAIASKLDDSPLYDVQINKDTYVFFHDELELVISKEGNVTLETLRQRKEQLTTAMLQLIQTFEQETHTQLSNIVLDIGVYTTDSFEISKTKGLKIYVKLE